MKTWAFAILALFLVGPALLGEETGQGKFDGTWEITALIDNGQVVPDREIRSIVSRDGRFTISGQAITFIRPSTGQTRQLLFITDPKTNPGTIDLAGTDKTGSRGIYMVAGDNLMLCISGPGIAQRPADFSSREGSHALLMTLKRVPPATLVSAPRVTAFTPQVPPPFTDNDMQRMLVGTWGHQDEDKVELMTLNADGSFSATKTWKRTFKRIFQEDVRSSGTWRIDGGVLITHVTASTENDLRGQVFSYRVNSLSPTEVTYIDPDGRVHREWKTR